MKNGLVDSRIKNFKMTNHNLNSLRFIIKFNDTYGQPNELRTIFDRFTHISFSPQTR